ncbi:hypothetical protein FE257_013097 [Aspergillus nanangensis]|uniref:FAD-dependent monooxygenase nanF n=2 Tax=Aspergillus nanangensis TaxID=2582783 RepID=NANF_ASPNN|nr:RecName: Full=FAD-dependent monooxygenase nanF; AltName: Full=Nanangelenin A biosynthesis cluster protein F [Aspergillus nanangensis]KAF9884569.1 hypothetical protein FE257_013097 [Aspergillus nanangensis]QIQ51367.1 hypothetical protein FE257_013097 [Aspergillus nanangensis]
MTVDDSLSPAGVATPHSSGIRVVVVGLGIAGLTTAIECHRKGHTVIALEKSPVIRVLGDSLGLGSNATNVLEKWADGKILQQLKSLADDISIFEALDSAGKLYAKDDAKGFGADNGMIINRGSLATTLHEYAKMLEIDIRFGAAVTGHWEDESAAGVIINGEQRLVADCVIGCDGIHSKTREAVLTKEPTAVPSGQAVFRASFDSTSVCNDPNARWILAEKGVRDRLSQYMAEGGLALSLATGKRGQNITWQLWHEDNHNANELWSEHNSAKLENALGMIRHWPIYSKVVPILRHTPKEALTDFKLVNRAALPTWISHAGRIIIIGDAAHPVLPIVGQGGGQGIEDAATVAICLQLAGKTHISLALQAVERLRYARTSIIQSSGPKIYAGVRNPDWKAIEKDPSLIMLPRPKWIFGYDVPRDVYEQFPLVKRAIEEGSSYTPKNIPPGGRYEFLHDFKE